MSPTARQTMRNRSFLEVVAVLFGIGLILELLTVALSISGSPEWLWFVPGIAALIGVMWLVSREPANL
jgi:FtsH-binding integral membrane protein